MPAGRPEAESVEAWRRGQGPRALDGRNLARKGQSRAGHGMDQSVVASLSCSSLVLGKVLLSRRCGERKVAFHARKKAASRVLVTVLSRLDTITAMTATQGCEKAGSSCSGIRAWASTPAESAGTLETKKDLQFLCHEFNFIGANSTFLFSSFDIVKSAL